ncbi:MAG TPA: HAD family hydrolase [Pyrinomonadaceae bacterium]|jgi:3-deoxy-D-manno-octulosonate 8-phosphate phosphatase (KDO 8-P phosphatase)|nr:HAD family hydrolase [Pyrinomonadaceae bacterium]
MDDSASIERRASHIKLLLMDCDGVLTDGRLWLTEDGDEQKSFNTHDGLGLSLLHRAGLKSGIITGRTSRAVARRARELGVEFVYQGKPDKTAAFEEILQQADVSEGEVAFIGDDLPDIPLMNRVELSVAVADAVEETRSAANYVTQARGGRGAVREVIELILKSQGRWHDLVDDYLK